MIKFDKETLQERREIIGKQLSTGIAEVTFTKVDGTLRTMPCTLDTKLMPALAVTEHHRTKPFKAEVMSVFCTDKQAWRSFRVENVISVVPIEG